MISVRIAVEPIDSGFAVRIGPDVLDSFATESEAMKAADDRAAYVRQTGGEAMVVVRSAAGRESGPRDEAGFPEELSEPK